MYETDSPEGLAGTEFASMRVTATKTLKAFTVGTS